MVKEADQVSYSTTPEVLEMHGGEVDVAVSVNYPAKYFHKKAVVTLTPVLRYEGGEKELDPLMLQGEDVTENYKTISSDGGGNASVSNTFEYEEEMMRSELYLNATASIKDKTAELGEVKLADGIVVTPLLVQKDPNVILFGDNYQRIVPKDYQADINYVINRADVRRSEITNEDIEKLNDTLQSADQEERLNLKGLEISAYASPDGPIDLNTRLAEQRKTSADRYLSGQLRRAEIEIAEELMSMMTTPEDWEGFKRLMEESDIQDKEMILRVLSMHSDPVVREQEIKNLSAAFEVIADEILPKLRRSKFTVKMEKVGWSDEELADLWSSNPDTLVLEELLYTATLMEDNQTKYEIYKKAVEEYPNCLRAHNNMGAILFRMGKTDEAQAALEDAKELRDHDIVNNNLGAVALVNGDVEAAKEAFTASLGAGDKVNYNLGIVNIIEGDYEAAVNYFGSEPSFNAALATYLKEDDEGAWRMLANLDKESPYRYYLMAIVAASQDKPDVAKENLRKSIDTCQDPQMMKNHARKNIEFAMLFNDPEFQTIVE